MPDIFELGATIDPTVPLLRILARLLHGPQAEFRVPDDADWSGRKIETLLKRQRVRVHWRAIINNTIMFTVCKRDAQRARRVLEQNGIPLL